ncbi:GAF and ANTAR domain-containing protein [Streptomyces sp. MBT33]|uniref:GAF and ANTAR domain-containing protein n=1 Tax=Streptomyces sp. MBT33 TaxID=1488363 RepID=UPI001909AE15|nr:GAF and ANTAR domain-containing protein [Streptomyces sp. MBT33]MBK3644446.1 GAF and ANTAR domain-containing protein [Streptomyces sp. MBT33]
MAIGGEASDPLASAERRAAAARARSAHETDRAERHERLAGDCADAFLRDLHLRIAAAHRSTSASHRTAARLEDAFAVRLGAWAGRPDLPWQLFMTGVAEACGSGGAALTLVGRTFDELALAASDEPSRAAQELEFLLGEGPARDATSTAGPVAANGAALAERWPGYGPAVGELGITEVAAVPLTLDGNCVGALAVYDPAPGTAGSTALAEIAEALTHSVILTPVGVLDLHEGIELRAKVHQAAGMVSVQLDRPVADALELIRAYAFGEGVPAHRVAERILAGEPLLGWGTGHSSGNT